MNYSEFVKLESERIGLDKIARRIDGVSGGRALVYCHDDPDGITSGIILTRLLKKKGVNVTLKIPVTMELEKSRLEKGIKESDPDLVFILDKATMGYYDEYADLHDGIIVIDHHPLLGNPLERITVANPVLGEYKRCSASFVTHVLSSYCGEAGEAEDIAALVGLKGDWAIEPATDDISDYIKPFYDEVKEKYSWLLRKIESRPTMFEVKQRKVTTLLNQLAEMLFALGGGGFQYFYNDRDSELKDITDGSFALGNFDSWLDSPAKFSQENEFLKALPESRLAEKIFNYFLSDWNVTSQNLRKASLVKTSGETDIFVFRGKDVKLMPMAGSVVLYELPSKNADTLFIMISDMGDEGFHFSFRSVKGLIHCGNFAHELALAFKEEHGCPDASGGGHPFAAECRTRKKLPEEEVMGEFEKKLAGV